MAMGLCLSVSFRVHKNLKGLGSHNAAPFKGLGLRAEGLYTGFLAKVLDVLVHKWQWRSV